VRYLKPALVGLVGGLLLAAAVLTVEFIHAQGVVTSQIRNCFDMTMAAGAGVCSGAVQVGGVEVAIAFALGFAATIIWFRRRQQ
jgi:hypothetical protein